MRLRSSVNPAATIVGGNRGESGVLAALGNIFHPLVRVAHPPSTEHVGEQRGQAGLAFFCSEAWCLAEEKKLAVEDTYLHFEQLDGGRMRLSKIASEQKVSWKLVRKV